ncbi:cupin domain-containing protein [Maribacter sp. PR1]|uniref:Cupin domain-containing protein n=1 Tax=Maribacter cobaltidurans TaxID=1178778 RepID=A0ABU7IXW2_9FLAO|nr:MULTISPECIES: cupin domain-containing protein [Maribacter]MDC6390443.1 cupin domain-containing protein [Maribacter sp. PR1]MEE1977832.1 cupin domain-containing protein [Maribacter cobaltidurans]
MYEIGNQISGQKYDKLQVEIVVETGKFDILSISLEKDAVFPNHSSPKDAQLIVLEGTILFHIDGESYTLSKYQHFSFPKQTEHWVVAKENSKFLIIR